ncbi:hypothetical protein EGH24_13745 [Halonotius terrestris]|uniref:Uncharacterized protein n=1 Tax=Halonotius terrestris TaxID=2487750 RepID=A0A8J8TBK3_9EURY|nr:hypothetical protein [Halonotius terrestris]TQQ78580.1 hypothetical protein EGH24_13745 [Halonotius terrestris]
MTANRWWVKMFARWQARIDASLQEINLGLRFISSGGIGSGALKYFGYSELVLPFLSVMLAVFLTYAFLTFEGGVKNQVARDRADMITNFAGPGSRIDDPLIGAAVFAALEGRPPDDEEFDAIEEAVDDRWREYRDGVEL